MKKKTTIRMLSVLTAFALIFTIIPLMTGELDAYAASAKKPAKVKSLKASLTSSNTVQLKWSKVKKTSGYAIYRNGKQIAKVSKSKTAYTDKKVQQGKTYKYYVKAYKAKKVKKWYNKKTRKYQTKKPPKKYLGKKKIVKSYKYGKKSPVRQVTIPSAKPSFTYTAGPNGGIMLTSYSGRDGKLVIPSSIEGKNVTAIGDSCLAGNPYIKSVEMPNTVVSIGDYAFECCSALTAVRFSSMLKSIGKGAFSGCAQLTSINIPDSVETIDDGAFLYCMACTDLSVSAGLSKLGQFAFAGMEKLERAEFRGNALAELPDRAFCNCTALKNLVLPESLSTIGKRAFSKCLSLTELTFPEDDLTVKDYAFEDTASLEKVTFEGNGLWLKDYVFKNNFGEAKPKVCELTLPSDVSLGGEDSSPAYSLAYSMITDVSLSGEGETYQVKDNSLYLVENGGLTLLLANKNGDENRVMTVDDETKSIADGAFYGCNVNEIVLPASLENIADSAFRAGFIRKITVADGNTKYKATAIGEEGVNGYALYEKCNDTDEITGNNIPLKLIRYCRPQFKSSDAYKYVVPDNVKVIAPYAFCNSGKEVTVQFGNRQSSQLEKISDDAFTGSNLCRKDMAGAYGDMCGLVEFDGWTEEDIKQVTPNPKLAFDYFMTLASQYKDDPSQGGPDSGLDPSDLWPYDDGDVNRPGEERDTETYETTATYESFDESRSLFSETKFSSFRDIHADFEEWSKKYAEYNKDRVIFTEEMNPYITLYKGDEHYRSMACVLNHDAYKHDYSVRNVGDDYEAMYLMMDHGLFVELSRPRVFEDIVMYSGITPQRAAQIAHKEDLTAPVSKEDLLNAIGNEYIDDAMISTTADPAMAAGFASSSNTMIMIYASKDALNELGNVDINCMSSQYASEEEILFGCNAKFKVLDVGTMTITSNDPADENPPTIRRCIKLELLGVNK